MVWPHKMAIGNTMINQWMELCVPPKQIRQAHLS